MLDAAIGLGHVLRDLATKTDDLDRLVLARRRTPAASRNAAAIIKQVCVEVGVADAVVGGADFAEIDAKVASALADGGGGKDVRRSAFLLRDFRLDSRFRRAGRLLHIFDGGSGQFFGLGGRW